MKKVFTLAALLLILSENSFARYSTDWIRPAEACQKAGVMIAGNAINILVGARLTLQTIFC